MKAMKWILLAGMVAALMVAVLGCSSDDKDPLVGTWRLQSAGGRPLTDAESMTVVLRSNGTYSSTTMVHGNVADAEAGTWSAANGIFTITPEGERPTQVPYILSGNTLTIGSGRDQLVFRK